MLAIVIVLVIVISLAVIVAALSLHSIGAAEVGLVTKRLAARSLSEGDPVARNGEAGYQAALLMPGLRFKLWPSTPSRKHPWVQVPAGEIGVVIAQVGAPDRRSARRAPCTTPSSATSATSTRSSTNGGQKGVQRPVLPPGTLVPIHPAAFLVITASRVYGVPVSSELQRYRRQTGGLTPDVFGLRPEQLQVTVDLAAGRDRHGRHRHRARGRSVARGRHRQPARRLRRRRRDARVGRRATPRSSTCCSAARTSCTTTTRTSRRS